MGLREWALGGVLLSPFLIYVLMALVLTGVLRVLVQATPWGAGSGTKPCSMRRCSFVSCTWWCVCWDLCEE